jgi:hypothetical protein
MSNIKFYTNRQIALQMAMELHREGTITKSEIIKNSEEFYAWLQDAPMKDTEEKDFYKKINEIK